MRSFLTPIGLLLAAVLLPASARAANDTPLGRETLVYVGTYTGPNKGQGIYLFRLQDATSQHPSLVSLGLAVETPSPSFLELDPRRGLVFAVNEVSTFEGKPNGSVSAFKIEPATGKLTLINQQPSMGTGPCHVVLDRTGKNLLIANYNNGSVAVIPVATDGTLGAPSCVIQHSGKSADPKRQQGPHAHSVTLSPDNRFAFVCDLGLDKVMAYRLDAQQGKLTPADPAFTAIKPGSGPRHMAFRPDGKFAYVINEMSSTITVLSYDAGSGRLTEIQTASTLPANFEGQNSTAEIAVHPSGKWLYGSNRGSDSVVRFDIDQTKGTIRYAEAEPSGGKVPRHFGIQSSGRLLIVENQNSNSVLLCRIDPQNGHVTPAGALTEVPAPVCAVFLEPVTAGRRGSAP